MLHILSPKLLSSWPVEDILRKDLNSWLLVCKRWNIFLTEVAVNIDILPILARRGTQIVFLRQLKKLNAQCLDLDEILLESASRGHEDVVWLLCEKGADANPKNIHARTPLLWAARMGHETVVKQLLEKGADVDQKGSNAAPLSWAAGMGHVAVMELLLEKGADVDLDDDDERTPLSWAAEYGHEAVVKLLENYL
ncbi:ankyrin repeat-containing domain protein [Rhexocercosporidium sp. MPI-PUGE-AT-0058]|nr:ankyrin repeat-containing domain protein [Rhexocercosporidium sp. MPI-PUGE-AT-0058]